MSRKQAAAGSIKTRWWQEPLIYKHINASIYNENGKVGPIHKAIDEYGIFPCKSAVSVGCGIGSKEIDLVNRGLVEHFDLYELSPDRIEKGKDIAEQLGLEKQINFRLGDAFEMESRSEIYDLVYWNNSLHHMLNVRDAIKWSQRVLKVGGGLFMDDFIGPSRFQWTDKQLEIGSRVRQCFEGTDYLNHPTRVATKIPTKVKRPTVQGMIDADPSEAADSGRIVECLRDFFPSVEISYTGGVVYGNAINDLMANIDNENEPHILRLLLLIDDLSSQLGENFYAVAMAKK